VPDGHGQVALLLLLVVGGVLVTMVRTRANTCGAA
jgi:hypothetical protein